MKKEIDSFIQNLRLFGKDTDMEFGKEKVVNSEDIQLLGGQALRSLKRGDKYEYLEGFEYERIFTIKMRTKYEK